MRTGHIISKHDADDPKIGHNGRCSGVTDDVEHTIFGREIRMLGVKFEFSSVFYAQNALSGRTDREYDYREYDYRGLSVSGLSEKLTSAYLYISPDIKSTGYWIVTG